MHLQWFFIWKLTVMWLLLQFITVLLRPDHKEIRCSLIRCKKLKICSTGAPWLCVSLFCACKCVNVWIVSSVWVVFCVIITIIWFILFLLENFVRHRMWSCAPCASPICTRALLGDAESGCKNAAIIFSDKMCANQTPKKIPCFNVKTKSEHFNNNQK